MTIMLHPTFANSSCRAWMIPILNNGEAFETACLDAIENDNTTDFKPTASEATGHKSDGRQVQRCN